ncbi:MAG TPA: hypothetical protein VL049_11330 [Candidatus Dormibacteraeota bacterium]|nr:hypothetical protein [Candidatus Dormibacteraeota bacterium]
MNPKRTGADRVEYRIPLGREAVLRGWKLRVTSATRQVNDVGQGR